MTQDVHLWSHKLTQLHKIDLGDRQNVRSCKLKKLSSIADIQRLSTQSSFTAHNLRTLELNHKITARGSTSDQLLHRMIIFFKPLTILSRKNLVHSGIVLWSQNLMLGDLLYFYQNMQQV